MWTSKTVTAELVRAFEVLFALPGDNGSGKSGFWPDMTYEPDEIEDMRARAVTENKKFRLKPSPRDVQRMEAVLLGEGRTAGWLKEYLQPGERRCLGSYAMWKALDLNISACLRRKNWDRDTFNNKVRRAKARLVAALNAGGVVL